MRVWNHPSGAKSGGLSGAIKGVGTGTLGLLTRPTKGGLSLLSEAATGLINTPATLLDHLGEQDVAEFRADKLTEVELLAKHTRALAMVREKHDWEPALRHLIHDWNVSRKLLSCVGLPPVLFHGSESPCPLPGVWEFKDWRTHC